MDMEATVPLQLAGHKMQAEYCAFLRHVVSELRPYPFLSGEVERLAEVESGVIQPFNVAVFGRMKTGKSTLINALIGKTLAITGVEEATATINRLTYGSGDQLRSFTVHWKDDLQETFPLETLQRDWNGKDAAVLERVARTAYLELFSDAPILKDVHVIDTPGAGSAAAEHEDAARQFINGQEADALIYVFSPVGRETDEEALLSFRKGCLPGSSPYNSVAVLHKWDHIFWENGGDMADIRAKAARLKRNMDKLVADVLPVSAPLALFAALAPAAFFEECSRVLAGFADEGRLTHALGRDSKWERDPACSSLWRQAKGISGMPWSSFQIMLRHLYRAGCPDAAEARHAIRDLSGFNGLRALLDHQFFKQAAVIRQQRTRERALTELKSIYSKISARLKDMEADAKNMERICAVLEASRAESSLRRWMELKKYAADNERKTLYDCWLEIDRRVIATGRKASVNAQALELLHWLDSAPSCFSEEENGLLRSFLSTFGTEEGKARWGKEPDLLALYPCVASLCNDPDPATRLYAGKLKECMLQTFC